MFWISDQSMDLFAALKHLCLLSNLTTMEPKIKHIFEFFPLFFSSTSAGKILFASPGKTADEWTALLC